MDGIPPTAAAPSAVIVSIGDELVLGQSVDTNSAYLSDQLLALGVRIVCHQTLADDLAAIAEVLDQASGRCDLVLVTGGLGPTDDDLTRQALSRMMGVPLVEDADSVGAIEAFFASRGRAMPDRNRIQAQHPRGSTILDNPAGTAPGICATWKDAQIIVMPGVPREMKVMFQRHVVPRVQAQWENAHVVLTRTLHSFGLGESTAARMLGSLTDRQRNPLVGTTVSGGIVSMRIRSEAGTRSQAQRALDATADQVIEQLGPLVFGQDDDTLASVLTGMLTEQRLTMATAESCTGGLVGALLTDVPGVSSVYRGGWVTYSNAMKQAELGVTDDVLAQHGAVSEATARAMAIGARQRADVDIAVSVTGIAGPDGGSEDKPVGTVWMAVAIRPGDLASRLGGEVITHRFRFAGDRIRIRDRAAKSALQMIRLILRGERVQAMEWIADGCSVATRWQQIGSANHVESIADG